MSGQITSFSQEHAFLSNFYPVNGQDSPDAALHAAYDEGLQTALALLEGGAE